ncbi:hypothetical protein LINGRAHAP2_LOCUS4256 [Linum grandiflorum]
MITIEISKPLPYGFWANEEEEMDWVSYKFERLPSGFCYSCGRLGHSNTSCEFKGEFVEGRYGEHTRAGPNSPAAPTPKKSGNTTNHRSPMVEKQQEPNTEAINPFWGALAGSITRNQQQRQEWRALRRQEEEGRLPETGDGGIEMKEGELHLSETLPKNLLQQFEEAADPFQAGPSRSQDQGKQPQTLVVCAMSPWTKSKTSTPRKLIKKRKKNNGPVICEAQDEEYNSMDFDDGLTQALQQPYISPYIPMEPPNQSQWRAYYGIDFNSGDTISREAYGAVATPKPPHDP